LKSPNEIDWKGMKEFIENLGSELILDLSPSSSGSGTIDGARFSLSSLTGVTTTVLWTQRIMPLSNPTEDPLVKGISTFVTKYPPFCRHYNKNSAGLVIVDWRLKQYQEERYRVLENMRDVYGLVRL